MSTPVSDTMLSLLLNQGHFFNGLVASLMQMVTLFLSHTIGSDQGSFEYADSLVNTRTNMMDSFLNSRRVYIVG